MNRHRIQLALSAICLVLVSFFFVGVADAHTVKHAGPYTLEIGWQHEPTYVGEANGVQIIVTDANDQPITDLKEDDIKVVVSTGSVQSGELTFAPGFDLAEGDGQFGEYDAAIEPTAPGDYTFHLTGAIHGQAVDITVTSGDETFDTVKGTSDIQFPSKLPTLTELVTRLDRIDARLTGGPTQQAVDAARTRADAAQAAADRALLIGGGIGVVGLAVGIWSLAMARRGPRSTKG
ncbi:MAG: hypothetical protein ACXWMN_02720 [Candidatus Limnocylindria bacterium]